MSEVPGARTFSTSGEAYDAFMGRYSKSLAPLFADSARIVAGQTVLDVGCGPGALTAELVDRLGADDVRAFDPSPSFVEACATRFPTVDVRIGRAEDVPFATDSVDAALSQLVMHFVSDPAEAIAELRRVVRPGGTVAACVWDFENEMEMLRAFWDAALAVDAQAPDEARTLQFGREHEIADLFVAEGLSEVEESTLVVTASYSGFDELWNGFLAGIGPAGSYCVALDADARDAVRDELFNLIGNPSGSFELRAVARSASATVVQ